METPNIEYSVRRFKDPRGMRNVFLFKDYRPIILSVLKQRIEAQENYEDTTYLTCGAEGSGKSMWNMLLIDCYEQLTEKELGINHVTRDLTELKLMLASIPERGFLTLDEGSELTSDRYAEKTVKDLRERFTIMRKRSHIVVLCFTNPLKINTYFREDRFRGLFLCKKRGTVYYYSADNVLDILTRIKSDMSGVRSTRLFSRYAPNYVMYNVPDYKGHLRKAYEERKDINIDAKLEASTINLKGMKTPHALAKDIGVKRATVNRLIDRLDLKYILLGNRKYLDMDAVSTIKKHLEPKTKIKRANKDLSSGFEAITNPQIEKGEKKIEILVKQEV